MSVTHKTTAALLGAYLLHLHPDSTPLWDDGSSWVVSECSIIAESCVTRPLWIHELEQPLDLEKKKQCDTHSILLCRDNTFN